MWTAWPLRHCLVHTVHTVHIVHTIHSVHTVHPMHFLISNDDGLSSPLLRALAQAIVALPNTRVSVVAPAREQSWIGRAVSRRNTVRVEDASDNGTWPGPAWAVHGTPTDCVNLALGHLLDERPDAVISGINIGLNATVPLILCSGTVGAAIEGAAWGLPAAAFSLHVSPEDYLALTTEPAIIRPELAGQITAAATHAAAFAQSIVGTVQPGLRVHNINFPLGVSATTPIRSTAPDGLDGGPLFAPAREPGTYEFRYRDGVPIRRQPLGDRACLEAREISHSILDFHLLGG